MSSLVSLSNTVAKVNPFLIRNERIEKMYSVSATKAKFVGAASAAGSMFVFVFDISVYIMCFRFSDQSGGTRPGRKAMGYMNLDTPNHTYIRRGGGLEKNSGKRGGIELALDSGKLTYS